MLNQLLGAFELVGGALRPIAARWETATLVVVDMQPAFFPQIDSDVLQQVSREICRAMRRGLPIVIVETKPHINGPTFRSLANLVKDYDRVGFARKRGMNGSRAILAVCRQRAFDVSRFRVCGVYTHYCVEETAVGLGQRRRSADVYVVKRACADPGGNNWSAFPLMANVFLV
ncbi:MAG TPA: isochorismatase family protein [Candidatus Obscuribacterales bacterium]